MTTHSEAGARPHQTWHRSSGVSSTVWRWLVQGAVLWFLFSSTGCLALWSLNQDPDGLPCSDDPARPCLLGYTCVQDDASGERLCRKAAIGDEGQFCQGDLECKEEMVCRDFFEGECDANSTDVNCVLGLKQGKVCHRVCDPNLPAEQAQCADGQRCFLSNVPNDSISGWCQQGTCELNSQCGTNAANSIPNFCAFAFNPPGPSGLCAYGCDPLRCNPNTGCDGCPATLGSCEPYGPLNDRIFGCVPPGDGTYGSPCDNINEFCRPGSVCLMSGNGGGYCAQFCNPQGGAPACSAGYRCNAIDAQIGFCG